MTNKRLGIAAAMLVTAGVGAAAYFGPDQYRIWKAKETVRELLRDPDSAVFTKIRAGELAVCGMVNSRNGYGAMAGAIAFLVKNDGKAELEPRDLFHGADEMERAKQYWFSMIDISQEAGERAGAEYREMLEEQKQYLEWIIEGGKACLTREERLAEAKRSANPASSS